MAASAQMSCMEAPWNPERTKQRWAAARISARRSDWSWAFARRMTEVPPPHVLQRGTPRICNPAFRERTFALIIGKTEANRSAGRHVQFAADPHDVEFRHHDV